MACRLFDAKPWIIVNWTLWNKLQWNFSQNTKLFILENASENVICEKAAILSRPSDAIWRQISGSTLAQVMACCLTAPSHYLNQCWLITSMVQWHSMSSVSQDIPQPLTTKISLKITHPKFTLNLPGANELKLTHLAVNEQNCSIIGNIQVNKCVCYKYQPVLCLAHLQSLLENPKRYPSHKFCEIST